MNNASSDVQPALDNFRCGMVSIIGRPNVGKSTLLNTILEEKVSIVSKVPQTTRYQVRGIFTDPRGQIIFIDTPGLFKGKDRLDRVLMQTAFASIDQADCVIHLVDSHEPTGEEERIVVERLKNVKAPVILGFNKIDLKGKYVSEYIDLWEKLKGKPVQEMDRFVLLPLSGKTKFHIDKLLDILFSFLPVGPALYPPDVIADAPQRRAVSDVIREKYLAVLREEVPHSLAVLVEAIQHKRKDLTVINALIIVERDSQKEIVIGKKGEVLKKVGMLARRELEQLMETNVYLDMHVKWQRKWRDDQVFLGEMGLEPDGGG